MTTAIGRSTEKLDENRGVAPKLGVSKTERQAELMDEFSSILDKIALQLAEMELPECHSQPQPRAEEAQRKQTGQETGKREEQNVQPEAEIQLRREEHKAVKREEKIAKPAEREVRKAEKREEKEIRKTESKETKAAEKTERKEAKETETESKDVEKETEVVEERLHAEATAEEQAVPAEEVPVEGAEETMEETVAQAAAGLQKQEIREAEVASEEEAENMIVEEEEDEASAAEVPAENTSGDEVEEAPEQAEREAGTVQKEPLSEETLSEEELQAAEKQLEASDSAENQTEEQPAPDFSENEARQEAEPAAKSNAEKEAAPAEAEIPEVQPAVQAPVQEQGTQLRQQTAEVAVLRHFLSAFKAEQPAAVNSTPSTQSTPMLTVEVKAQTEDGSYELKAKVKELPRALSTRTMEKVESALKEMVRAKDGKTISVRLDPPELGQVKVDVTMKDGALHARLIAENQQVNQLLKEKSGELQQMLRKMGLNVDRVSVSVNADGQRSSEGSYRQYEKSAEGRNFGKGLSGGTRQETAAAVAANPQSITQDDHWIA